MKTALLLAITFFSFGSPTVAWTQTSLTAGAGENVAPRYPFPPDRGGARNYRVCFAQDTFGRIYRAGGRASNYSVKRAAVQTCKQYSRRPSTCRALSRCQQY